MFIIIINVSIIITIIIISSSSSSISSSRRLDVKRIAILRSRKLFADRRARTELSPPKKAFRSHLGIPVWDIPCLCLFMPSYAYLCLFMPFHAYSHLFMPIYASLGVPKLFGTAGPSHCFLSFLSCYVILLYCIILYHSVLHVYST